MDARTPLFVSRLTCNGFLAIARVVFAPSEADHNSVVLPGREAHQLLARNL